MADAAWLLPLLTEISLIGIARTLRTRSLLYLDLLLAAGTEAEHLLCLLLVMLLPLMLLHGFVLDKLLLLPGLGEILLLSFRNC